MNRPLPSILRTVVSLAILAAGGGAFLWMGTPEVPTQEPRPEPPPLVDTQPAVAHTEGITFEVDGVVVPYREIQIASQVAGRVSFKSDDCRSGRTVRKGELLLKIEPDDYQLEVRRLVEELAQAEAMIRELAAEIKATDNQIASTKQQLAIDTRMLKRSQDLMSRSAASDTEVDSARKAELTTRNTLQSLLDQKNLLTQRQIRMESAKSLVQANLERAELDLKRTQIFSPIDGVVVSENVEQDGYVQSGGTMLVLQDTSQLDVSCKLYMRQMNWLWQSDAPGREKDVFQGGYDFPETPATVVYELGGERYAWDAVVQRYDGAGVDSQTRMVPCRVHVQDPTRVMKVVSGERETGSSALVTTPILTDNSDTGSANGTSDGTADLATAGPMDDEAKPTPPSMASEIAAAAKNTNPPTLMTGMFVKVRIHATPPIPMVRLPQKAIQPGNKVWLVQDGVLTRRAISVASSSTQDVVAYQRAGELQAGDLVVTSPLATPVEGMPVRTTDEVAASDGASRGGGKTGRPATAGPPRAAEAGGIKRQPGERSR